MCGFIGFWNRAGLDRESYNHLVKMTNSIKHRGPDDSGYWLEENDGVAFGHRRLSIVDLSPAGHQPMASMCGRWMIVYNGEIYNHLDIRKELQDLGVPFDWKGHSDTETLLAAISYFGIEGALKKCVGMFAFALWDKKNKTMTLARDRVGEKPLYYGWSGNTFIFGSDLISFRHHPQWKGIINRSAISLLTRYKYIPAPYSIFENVNKLMPGSILTLNRNYECKIEKYWDAENSFLTAQSSPFLENPTEAVDQLEQLLKQSIEGQMMADVPVGAFLSGGIDSSVVVSLMQSLSKKPIRTFSIGFNDNKYNEAEYAKAIANHLGTDHTELYCTPQDSLDIIPKLSNIYSEPFADSSQIPTILVSHLAKQQVTVSLSGDGGDELFGGYGRYKAINHKWDRLKVVPYLLRKMGANFIHSLSPLSWNKISSTLSSILPGHLNGNLGHKLYKLSEIIDSYDEQKFYHKMLSHYPEHLSIMKNTIDSQSSLSSERIPEFPTFVQKMMYSDFVTYLPDDVLVKVDRASMSVGLECRVPLLDHRLVEFAWSLPFDMIYREGKVKWPLRQVLDRYVPKNLVERPKMGFGIPVGDWLKDPLRDWCEHLLDKTRLEQEEVFDTQKIQGLWQNHLSGASSQQSLLWSILMFESWYEDFNNA
jgi:asparagine synthase (glutamine-hydrolysing)